LVADAPPEDDAEVEAVAEPRTTLLPGAAALLEKFRQRLGDAVIESDACYGDAVVRVKPEAWLDSARVAHDELGCDYLSFIAGIDWMPTPTVAGAEEGSGDTSAPVQPRETTYGVAGSAGRFQVFARVDSTNSGAGLTLKTDITTDTMRVDSWTSVYPGRRLARARSMGDVRLRVHRSPGAAPPLPPCGVRGSSAAQGLPAPRARGEAVAGSRRRRADAGRRAR
jgi:NADH:ubiquinone oxidoreductase subunit C